MQRRIDWNWNGARRSLERALELNADHTQGWLLYGRLLEALGYLVEGLAAKQRGLERDPSSATGHLQIALSYWNQRCYDDMIAWRLVRWSSIRTTCLRAYLAGAYVKTGDLDRHMAESLTHARAAGCPVELLDDLRRAYDDRGRTGVVEFASRINANGPPVQLALLHGEIGHLDEAFRHLDAAIALRDLALVHLAIASQWDCLRGGKRFGERLQAMGFAAAADLAQRVLQRAKPPRTAT